jgi:hypothetical protein
MSLQVTGAQKTLNSYCNCCAYLIVSAKASLDRQYCAIFDSTVACNSSLKIMLFKMALPNSYELAGYRVLKRHLIPIAIVVPSIFEHMSKG